MIIAASLGLFLACSSAGPAQAALHNPISANASGDPTDTFFDNQSLWAYFTSDLAGGRICVVSESGGLESLGCDRPLMGTATTIAASIGTQFILVKDAKLRPGTFRLLVEDSTHKPLEFSIPFTVSPCPGCDPDPDKAIVDAYKSSAAINSLRMGALCEVQGHLQELANKATGMRGINEDVTVKATGTLSLSTPSYVLTISGAVGVTITIQDPLTVNINKGLDILKAVSCGAKLMYHDMAQDPPDPDYNVVAIAAPREIGPLSPSALDATVRSIDRQRAFIEASRQAFERYQGAKAAGDVPAQIAQLQSSGTHATNLAHELIVTASALRLWAAQASDDPQLSGTILTAADKTPLAELYSRIATTGFSRDEIAQFHSFGYSDTEIAAIRTHATLGVNDIPVDTTYPTALLAWADGLEAEAVPVSDFASEVLADAARLEAGSVSNPAARFTVSSPRNEGGLLTFDSTASTTPDGLIVRRDWDFGDGDAFPGGGSVVSHSYVDDGTYTVRLTVVDSRGLSDTTVQDVVVDNVAPSSTLTFPARVPPGVLRIYGVQAADPGAQDHVSASVDFGDGSTPTSTALAAPARSASLEHTYVQTGTFIVEVTVSDEDGGSSVRTSTVTVAAAVADAGADQSVDEGQSVSLGGVSSSPADPDTSFVWDFGDGATGSGRTTTHRYADNGRYTARLTVTDLGGTASTDSATISVANVAPTVSLLAPTAAEPGAPASLRAFSTDPGSADTTAYQWDLGDGTTANGSLVDHIFAAPGTYQVKVRAEDDDGGTDTRTQSVVVAQGPPGDGRLDSRGTDFWLAMMTNLNEDVPAPQLLISSETSTHGTVEIPGLGFQKTFTVAAGGAAAVTLPAQVAEPAAGDILPWGIHVSASSTVSVYGLNQGPVVTDGFLGLPREVLGDRYVAVGYPGFSGGELGVLATRNGTTVTLTAPDGRTLVRNLDAGDVWLAYAGRDGGLATNGNTVDFTGVHISSSHPVAAFSGAVCANVPTTLGACNHLVEQLTPTSQWGTHFLTAPLATRLNGDRIRVVAESAGTEVTINGSHVATLAQGEYHEQVLVGPAEITTSKPTQVAYFAHGVGWDFVTGDPSMTLVVPAEQHLASYVISTPGEPFQSHYVNVVAPTAHVGHVVVDGDTVPSASFAPIAGSGWSYAQLRIAPGAHWIHAPVAFGLTQYGWGAFDAYSWPGGTLMADLAAPSLLQLDPATLHATVGTQGCVKASVTDERGGPVPSTRVDWTVAGAHPSSGQGFADANGSLVICSSATSAGTDTITAQAAGLTASSTITWTSPNSAPVADAGTVTTNQDTAVDITLTGHDADRDPLVFTVTRGPEHGTLTGAAPALRYTPAPGYRGPDSLAFQVSDGRETSEPAEVSVTVVGVNHAPDARDAAISTDEDTATDFVVAATDPDGDTVTFTISDAPQHGSITGSPPSLTYRPAPDFSGRDSLRVRACDAGIPGTSPPLCDTATISVTVRPVNDAPAAAASPLSQQVQYSDPVAPVRVTVTDPDTDLTTLTVATTWKRSSDTAFLDSPPLASLVLTASPPADGSRTWILSGRASVAPGSYSIRFTASDGARATTTDAQVIVTRESAVLQYTGDLFVSAGSGGTGSLTLAAGVVEEADGALGSQLAAATVKFDVFTSTDLTLSAPLTGCTAAVTSGDPGSGTAACKVTNVPTDTYTIRAVLTSGYYAAPEEVAAATVSATTPGSATGGGWLTDASSGTRSNFGFTLKSSSSRVSGNSLYIYRSTIGERVVKDSTGAYLPGGSYTWVVKSNAMKTYAQQCSGSTTCTATFSGKANIKAVNRTSGKAYSLGGGFGFDVTIVDRGEPGTRPPSDSYAIRVTDGATSIHSLGSAQAGVALGGGNIQIRQLR